MKNDEICLDVAVKRTQKMKQSLALKEIDALKEVIHDNIVRYYYAVRISWIIRYI